VRLCVCVCVHAYVRRSTAVRFLLFLRLLLLTAILFSCDSPPSYLVSSSSFAFPSCLFYSPLVPPPPPLIPSCSHVNTSCGKLDGHHTLNASGAGGLGCLIGPTEALKTHRTAVAMLRAALGLWRSVWGGCWIVGVCWEGMVWLGYGGFVVPRGNNKVVSRGAASPPPREGWHLVKGAAGPQVTWYW